MTQAPRPSAKDAKTRLRMARTPRRDTTPELRLRSFLHAMGFRYRVNATPVSGERSRADLVFRTLKVAIFVDGCFWHGCPRHATHPRHNAEWWRAKLDANRERDSRHRARLRGAGWIVLRVWEHESPAKAAVRIARVLRTRSLQLATAHGTL